MTSFINAYKKTGNSIIAYKQVKNCDDKPLKDIVKESFLSLEQVFEEVDFYVSNENKRGILRNVGKIIKGFVSCLGSYNLELHTKHYSDMYEAIYKPARIKIESIEKDTNDCLTLIGEQLTELKEILKPVGNILTTKTKSDPATRYSLTRINKFNTGFDTSLKAGFGGIVGGSTALGAWGLVSLIGSASTGTAISSLSGAAATNATFAWFGGGSLATGGAGIAGGFWVLGGIVAAPIVFFSTKSAYKKVDDVKEKKNELTKESEKIINLTLQASTQLMEARKRQRQITALLAEYVPNIKNELKLYKCHRSLWKSFFGCKMNVEQEKHYNNLHILTSELLGKLGIE